jgi:hypothetical protein
MFAMELGLAKEVKRGGGSVCFQKYAGRCDFESINGHLDTAATPPAEASGVCGAAPGVFKEESVLFVRN